MPDLIIYFSQMRQKDKEALVRLLARVRDHTAVLTGVSMQTDKLLHLTYEGEEVKTL